MNSSSTNLVYVDAAGWIALVNRRDSLHTQAVRIYRQLLQEQCQFITSSVVLLEVGNWLSPAPLRGLMINLLHRIEQSSRNCEDSAAYTQATRHQLVVALHRII